MTRVGAAPASYFGGKQGIAERIVRLFPPHDVYLEPYCGLASVYFCKPPSRLEIIGDLDGALINFFRVLRDPVKGPRLREALELTPYAREEWADARLGLRAIERGWDEAADDVEVARRWFVLAQQSFAGRIAAGPGGQNPGWRFTANPSHNPAQSYRHSIDRLPSFMQRLRYTQIEHDDALALIPRYDSPRALMYCDPPYVQATRRGGGYAHEMTLDDHERLLDVLTAPTLRAMVVLSGYDSALYRERLEQSSDLTRRWQRLELTVACSAAGRTRSSGLQGAGAVYRAGQTRTELLWLNPAAQQAQGLWASEWASALLAGDAPDEAPPPAQTTKPTTRRRRSATNASKATSRETR